MTVSLLLQGTRVTLGQALAVLELDAQKALDEARPALAAHYAEAKGAVRLAISAVQDAEALLTDEPSAELDSTRIESG